jgi:2-dehydro-3-deoxyphosphogluconate aldolase/(4S)-4-hydroxy-2-oxoglutarate aldolase
MNRQEVRARIEDIGIIPAIRVSTAEDALFAAEAVSNAGIPIVEVTMTVPGAMDVIYELARVHPHMLVGAGTVLNALSARACLDAGAKFLTSTGLDMEVIHFARNADVVVIPGVLSPTEVITAWKAGADFMKIFPCANVGGAEYVRALHKPFPEMQLIASGGVTQNSAADFIRAGAVALGIGQNLVEPEAIQKRERGWIQELAKRFTRIVQETRAEIRDLK